MNFGQVFVKIATVVTKAAFTAYRVAVSKGRGGGSNPASAATVRRVKNGMKISEAYDILNIPSSGVISKEVLEANFAKYFANNNPKTGGSFYLQSKIYRAKEVLDKELIKQEQQKQGQKL